MSECSARVAALLVAPLFGVGCSTTELVPLSPNRDGGAVVREAELELEAEVQPGEHSVPSASPAAPAVPDPNTSFQADGAHGRDVTTEPLRRAILATAFTGGEIASGQTESGLIYFATPPKHVDRVRLVVPVRAREGRLPAATVEIPYAVKS